MSSKIEKKLNVTEVYQKNIHRYRNLNCVLYMHKCIIQPETQLKPSKDGRFISGGKYIEK